MNMSYKFPKLVSISIEFIEDNPHSSFVNSSLYLHDQIVFDIFDKKPPFVVLVNWPQIVLFFDWKPYRLGDFRELCFNWLAHYFFLLRNFLYISIHVWSALKFISKLIKWLWLLGTLTLLWFLHCRFVSLLQVRNGIVS